MNVSVTSSILCVDHHGNTQGYPADKPSLVSDVVPKRTWPSYSKYALGTSEDQRESDPLRVL